MPLLVPACAVRTLSEVFGAQQMSEQLMKFLDSGVSELRDIAAEVMLACVEEGVPLQVAPAGDAPNSAVTQLIACLLRSRDASSR